MARGSITARPSSRAVSAAFFNACGASMACLAVFAVRPVEVSTAAINSRKM